MTDVAASHGAGSDVFRRTAKKAIRLLSLICIAAILVGLTLTAFGVWSTILGLPPGLETEMSCLALTAAMGLGIPLGAGQRILLGLGKQTLSTLILGIGGILSLANVSIVHAAGQASFALYGIAFASGPLVAQSVVAFVAWRLIRQYPRDSCQKPTTENIHIRRVALPMAVIAISLPLAYQSDRVVLSHFSSTEELAIYSVVAVLYSPLLSIVNVGGQTLWPMFIRTTEIRKRRAFHRQSMFLFAILGFLLALGLTLFGPFVASFMKSGVASMNISESTYIVFSLLLFMFAVHTTNGMLLMDASGRRMQAIGSFALLSIKIPLSVLLATKIGANGVVLASIISAMLCLVIPAVLAVRRRLRPPPCISAHSPEPSLDFRV
ncbi:MAG: hypothetical protein Q4P05_08805 [Actinomycetaceae bacterium]|nr:hypothetical protein [Actinomycetaceae bacterium]